MPPENPETRGSWLGWVMLIGAGALLFKLLFPSGSGPGPGSQKSAQARNDAMQLITAFKWYKVEYGSFPQGTHAQVLDIICGNNPRKVAFFETRKEQVSKSGEYLDPWGSPYRIVISDEYGPRVYSIGKDRVDDGGRPDSDDVTSWR